MRFNRKLATVGALALLLLVSGCKKKKPSVVPPQAQAPTVTAPAPEPQTAPAQQPATPPTTSTPTTQPQPPTTTPAPPKPKRSTRTTTTKKTTSEETKTGTATKKVVSDGSSETPSTGDISVGMEQGEAAHQRQATESLLAATEANLNSLKRALTSDETAMVEEVRNYMAQARQAITDSDLVRANNLATKAHLLSDALIKR